MLQWKKDYKHTGINCQTHVTTCATCWLVWLRLPPLLQPQYLCFSEGAGGARLHQSREVNSPTSKGRFYIEEYAVIMKWSLLIILLEGVLLCSCQTSFTVTRFESGDEVQSSMTSADYCSAIHGYLDGSQCKCNYRRTFSLESQTCIDYYNGQMPLLILERTCVT